MGEVIPEFNHSFVLPPFVGEQLGHAQGSPYPVTALELVQRFAISTERCVILSGLMDYRAALRRLGFVQGFQWLDGSFVENIEAHQNRAPNDVDVVTFAYAPDGLSSADVQTLMNANKDLFVKECCQEKFRCDPMMINLGKPPEKLIQDVRYWYGLFSPLIGAAITFGKGCCSLRCNRMMKWHRQYWRMQKREPMMLPQLERQFLQADLAQVQALLAQCSPDEDPIEHFQYGQRVQMLQRKLAAMPASIATSSAGAALFFGGRPVAGSYGIKAAFSGQAIEQFQKIVSQRFAAHEQGTLAAKGRVPFRDETQLLVTDVVRGSFGFILQVPATDSDSDKTALKTAVDEVAETLFQMSASDDTLFDQAAASLDDRQLGTLQAFFKLLDDEGASLRLVEGERDFELDRPAVSRARARIEGLSIADREQQLSGQIIGWSNYSGQFDLVPHESGNVIRGVVTREALERVELEGINPYKQHIKAWLKVREISVRNRSPKLAYTLTGFEIVAAPPDWPAQPFQYIL